MDMESNFYYSQEKIKKIMKEIENLQVPYLGTNFEHKRKTQLKNEILELLKDLYNEYDF